MAEGSSSSGGNPEMGSAQERPWRAQAEGTDPLEELLRSVERGGGAGDSEEFGSDPDVAALEALTKRLADTDLGLGHDILGEGLGTSQDVLEGPDSDEDEFTERLLREFRQMTQADATVPQARLKELYLDILNRGSQFMQDRGSVEEFLSGLSPSEMQSLMDLLASTPADVIRSFQGDPDVVEALRNAPDIPTLFGGPEGEEAGEGGADSRSRNPFGDLGLSAFDFIDSDDSLDEDEESVSARVSAASDAVKKALEIFRADILHYVQNPEELMKLANSMPTPKEQNELLDIIFAQYTPEKLRQDIQGDGAGPREGSASAGKPLDNLLEVMDPQLVAHVFKEVLTRFKAFKSNPHRFDALTQRLNKLEMQAFESLVEAFWDVGPGDFRV